MIADGCDAFAEASEPEPRPTVTEYANVSGSGLIAGQLFNIGFDPALRQAQVGR